MAEHYEIVPGQSIGPFELGMTRDRIEALNIHPKQDFDDRSGAYYPLTNVGQDTLQKAHHPRPGVNVHYDTSGKCHKLTAIFGYKPFPPVFTLYGRIVNGMTDKELASLLRSVADDVGFSYASVYSSSAGLRATKWEASDDHIVSIQVMPSEAPSEPLQER